AAEHLAPDAATGSAHYADPEMADEEGIGCAGGTLREGLRQLSKILGPIRSGVEGRGLVRLRKQRANPFATALSVVGGSREIDDYEGLWRTNEGRPGRDLLSDRRIARRGRKFPAPRGVKGEGI